MRTPRHPPGGGSWGSPPPGAGGGDAESRPMEALALVVELLAQNTLVIKPTPT